jgi:magnesium chelatase family protein
VLPAMMAAVKAGFDTVMVAEQNAAEAALVPDMRIIAAGSLAAAADWLRGTPGLRPGVVPAAEFGHYQDGAQGCQDRSVNGTAAPGTPDLAEVLGQELARKGLEICAAGGHHLSLLGPPGAGKTMLAERLPGILPRLEGQAALEVTSIHSVAGTLPATGALLAEPPFLAPHHTATKAAIVGGGTGILRPGAASLAHRGVLFLDEAPEFSRDALDALRQPLESGQIVLARSGASATFPARFSLVLAANPCPCARASGPARACSCSPSARRRYLGRLSGPLLDRVDVKIELLPVGHKELLRAHGQAESSAMVAARVTDARDRAARRLAGTPWRLNAEVPGSVLRCQWPPVPGSLIGVERSLERGQISARGVVKVIRTAWTIADLTGQARPGKDECDAALGLWLGVTT